VSQPVPKRVIFFETRLQCAENMSLKLVKEEAHDDPHDLESRGDGRKDKRTCRESQLLVVDGGRFYSREIAGSRGSDR
jgi:hypothetical protein